MFQSPYHRRTLQRTLIVAIGIGILGFQVGCQTLLTTKTTTNYRTIQANPNRDTAKAKELHKKAIKALSQCDASCYDCQCVAKVLCDPCKAEQQLQAALIADVRYGPAHNTLGTIYLSQRKLYLAAWEFEYASGLMPERGEPLSNLGLVYEEAGRLGHAIVSYEEAHSREPRNAEYIGNLARASLKQGPPLDEVRYLLKDLLLYDSRPGWVRWAEELLGTNISRETIESLSVTSEEPFGGLEEIVGEEISQEIEVLPAPTLVNPSDELPALVIDR